jgi:alanyl-tRNA synthetase
LAKAKNWNAGNMVKELAKDIKGGGGGQPTFATAGGTDVAGLGRALAKVQSLLN